MFSRKLFVITAAFWELSAMAQQSSDVVGYTQEASPAPAAIAAPVVAPVRAKVAPRAEAAEIASINERISVMAARLAELDMQAKIAAKQAEISRVAQESSGLSQIDEMVVPSVSEISGIDKRIWAVLHVQGGTQTVRVGDVAAGWKVVAIKHDTVTVSKKGRTLHLSFGNRAIQAELPRAPGSMAIGGMPNANFSGR